jgi:hypothetical protein
MRTEAWKMATASGITWKPMPAHGLLAWPNLPLVHVRACACVYLKKLNAALFLDLALSWFFRFHVSAFLILSFCVA